MNQALVFEIMGLSEREHSVFIKQNAPAVQTGVGLVIDAIDIDETGELKPYNPILISAPINLTAIHGDSQVTLNWDAVTDATGYNVKRSFTAGGQYETIANASGTSYVDTNVVNGTTYYYVVTAVNADGESANSNEASATPQAASVEEGQGLLRVTMIELH
ncbi:Fibronectin type III domain-containing protein [Propionispora hippei DSM 15287]|uniref:Fibronectin type III domain-containing protein n=1 Tax=Propionispora hippei DSM 15287 TaxID=1123003 RepID=A0A1M6CYX0_9FIRM|nr:Fibronectin type III domain-containing protein [Propionispora hippei DSM 15287]